ncbi:MULTISPECIES: hypothetical protein [Bacillus cereus group]|uniref:Uncharacterized protein n=1 Tax=Bacillus thuringiensis serovar navarrensis TaxID=339658 RepID=A0A243ASU0_BACTU|nr:MULTISPECIES: hypothetical protein [Bacillus cereus group]OTY31097.1 hypothetical protein BK732_00060 [Bacillus thuringiensis serovar navarrensis]OUB81246.1 hypothetical protein BK788_23915 [Bacillus thuringiensis serovar sinensis]
MNSSVRVQEQNEQEDTKKILEGIAVAFAFLVVGLVLYFIPDYLGNKYVTLVVSIILLTIAIIGFSIEISKTLNGSSDFTINIVLGGLFVTAAYTLHYYFPIWWINILGLIILLMGVYAVVLGMMKLVAYVFNSNGGSISTKIFLIITQILTVLSALAAIFEALGIKVDVFK